MSNSIVEFNEEIIKGKIKKLVWGSVKAALIEMYWAGVSVRRVEGITETLWGSRKYMNIQHLEAMEQETLVDGSNQVTKCQGQK